MEKAVSGQITFVLMAILITGFASTPVHASKVYKWVDEDGGISYHDKPPPAESPGKVEEKELDSKRNVIKYDSPTAPPKSKQKTGKGKKPAGNGKAQAPVEEKPGMSYEEYIIHQEERRRLEQQKADELKRIREHGSRIKRF